MKRKKIQIAVITFLFFVGVFYIVWTGLKKSWVYYYTIDEFFEENPVIDGKVFRLQGKVIPGSVEKKGNIVFFEIGNEEKRIKVIYKGPAPDMLFSPDAQVVVEGKYNPDENVFIATFLMTQCPSKYEGKKLEPKQKEKSEI